MRSVLSCCLFLTVLPAACAHAQADSAQFPEDREYESAEPKRKTPGFFHRPKQNRPSFQLFYARKLEEKGHLRAAARQYRALVHEWHSTPQAVEAQQAYARLLEERGRYEKAFDEYQYLVDFFPGRFDHADVVGRQFAIANYVMKRGEKRWMQSPEKAIPLFEKVVGNAPSWERAGESQFYIGWIHEAHHQYEEAVAAYEIVRFRYPDSEFAEGASFRRSVCLRILARKNRRSESALREALSALTEYLRDYGTSHNADDAREYQDELKSRLAEMHYKRASFYDRIARRPRAAIIAYRDFLRHFPSSEKALEVDARITELQARLETPVED